MKFTVHGGHAAQGNAFSGASGLCSESVEDRKIKEAVIKYLKQAGHTVYDCTVDSGPSQSAIITAIKRKINSYSDVTANISIHLNCYNGNAHGTECCIYSDSGAAKQMAERICSKISSLGFTDRGVKKRTDLGVLKEIYNGGINILVETFFCDSQEDNTTYQKVTPDVLGKAIAEGVLNSNIEVFTEKNLEKQDIEGRTATMQCFYTIDGKGPVYYFDGKEAHPLSHQDEMNILNEIYKDNNGKDMPCYSWSSTAPYHTRLLQAVSRKE